MSGDSQRRSNMKWPLQLTPISQTERKKMENLVRKAAEDDQNTAFELYSSSLAQSCLCITEAALQVFAMPQPTSFPILWKWCSFLSCTSTGREKSWQLNGILQIHHHLNCQGPCNDHPTYSCQDEVGTTHSWSRESLVCLAFM